MLKTIITITGLVTLLFVQSLSAQSITGKVYDAKTKDPLPGANIKQTGTTNGVATTNSGTFRLTLTSSGAKSLTISYVGYKTQTVDLENRSNDKKLAIYLLPVTIMSGELQIQGLRVDSRSAVTYTDISQKQIEKQNLGQDIPYLINYTPSVVTTSDAGAGVGYTGIRIRGVDPTRINVTINGIPLNDSEEQAVYWVDIPDLASSIQSLQIQRGVGSSTNGAGDFGASINIQTTKLQPDAYGDFTASYGSFNTQKYNLKVGTGLLKNGWSFNGRLSKISSDGYIDRAFSHLKSFFLTGSHYGDRSLLSINLFSGKEKTYQAWYGVEQSIMDTNRTYNPYTYPNQTDNYVQTHLQVLYSYKLQDNWIVNGAVHYTKGAGYYEEYKKNQTLSDYLLSPVIVSTDTLNHSDLIRQKWLNNKFYGFTYSTNYKYQNRWTLDVGGAWNEYDGGHYGRVVWAQYFLNEDFPHTYYDNNATKKDFNIYGKYTYNLTDDFSLYTDQQLRKVSYDFLGNGIVMKNGQEVIVPMMQHIGLTFYNPKVGLNYQFGKRDRLYASYGVAHKEPGRDEYVNSTPQSRPRPEALYDLETGYRYETRQFYIGATGYWMRYIDQLILTGQINDVGAYVRQNVRHSYRLGLELEGGLRLTKHLQWSGNATFSRNRISKYHHYIDNYDTGSQTEKTFYNTDIAFSPNIIFHSIFHYNIDGFEAELRTRYVSKQYLDNTQNNSRIIPSYFVSDLRLQYGLHFIPSVKNVELTLLVNNIFNELYESNGYTYEYISNGKLQDQNYYYPQATRNFLLQAKVSF